MSRSVSRREIVDYYGTRVTLPEASRLSGVCLETLRTRVYRGLRGAELFDPVERDTTPWEHDGRCRKFVRAHPNGASLREVGDYLGVSYERVRQIEEAALRKLRNTPEGRQMLSEWTRGEIGREHGHPLAQAADGSGNGGHW